MFNITSDLCESWDILEYVDKCTRPDHSGTFLSGAGANSQD